MIHFRNFVFLLSISLVCASCGGNAKKSLAEQASGDMNAYESSDVHAIQQALPTIMIIPGDNLLKNYKCAEIKTVNGREMVVRDYQRFLLKNDDHRVLFAQVQDAFVRQNYPLVDLVQALKNLNTQDAYAVADNLQQDMKTMLLQTCHPDIIIELNYTTPGIDMTSHNYGNPNEKYVKSFSLVALDAYTSKAISSLSDYDLRGSSIADALVGTINKKMSSLSSNLVQYYSDILTRGREVNIRFVVQNGANIRLSDNSVENEPISDYLLDYVKANTVKGAYTMQANSDYELSFGNARIKVLNSDGTQFGVYDWARACIKKLNKDLGLKATNVSQGLGDVIIIIKGY